MWGLLDTGIRSAAENIALDSALLEAKANNKIPDTLRFLQFSPLCVLIGYHQSVEQEVRVEFCKENKIDINRRITGGGAIFFDSSSLGWELIASKSSLGFSLDKITRRVCEAVVNGLNRLGIGASFRPRNDIEVNGRKISGTGGVFENGAVLFQGTLLVDFDVDTMMRALRIPTEKLADKELASVRQRITCLREELGKVPPLPEIKQALQKGFEEVLKIRFKKMELSKYVQQLFEKRKNQFASKAWIESIREPINNRQTLKGAHRAKGGLIRASLVIDIKRRMLKQVLITGDFFISPPRTIYDLEASLKDVLVKEVGERIEQFFKEKKPEMIGLSWLDFLAPFLSGLEKMEYPSLGIPLEEANYLFTVNGKLNDILKKASVLLLPYCAKGIGCEYRYKEGCRQCGGCSVGKAYQLAEKYGLCPITIRNYEHLKKTLYKISGCKSYIGSCCEAFFNKHQKTFRDAGIPGLLIDIENSTCYDLDKEDNGLAGEFENQTNLRLGLLEKVIGWKNPDQKGKGATFGLGKRERVRPRIEKLVDKDSGNVW